MTKVEVLYRENALSALLLAGFSPIPFKLFTIASGMMKVPLGTFVSASGISRTARFMLVASVVYFLGDKAKDFIDKYFDILTILLCLVVVGGFALVKFIFRRF